ncbi:ADP compounds hydrolase NudE [Aliikangiella sp. IMCC44653]
MTKKPQIISTRQIAKTRLFCVEEIALEFSNGAHRTYERMVAGKSGAVMIVALTAKNELILIREYSAGTHDYQLAFPKGLIDANETPLDAANRELKEEAGFGARKQKILKVVSLAPGYFTHKMHIVFAEDLYPERLPGDEPEPLEVVKWPFTQLGELLDRDEFSESRSIAALLLLQQHLKTRST